MVVRHKETVDKARAGLESGVPVRRQTFTDSERAVLVNYQLLTDKNVIAVFNTDEGADVISISDLDIDPGLTAGVGQVSISARIEAELSTMDPEEANEFRADLDLGESATSQVIRASYENLGLVSFLTVGDDEVRAWSVPGGMPAVNAAGVIHTDFTRGVHPGGGHRLRRLLLLRRDGTGPQGGTAALRGEDLPGQRRGHHQLPGQHVGAMISVRQFRAEDAEAVRNLFVHAQDDFAGSYLHNDADREGFREYLDGALTHDLAHIEQSYLLRRGSNFWMAELEGQVVVASEPTVGTKKKWRSGV